MFLFKSHKQNQHSEKFMKLLLKNKQTNKEKTDFNGIKTKLKICKHAKNMIRAY